MASKDPYRYFRIEAREIADGLGRDLIELETRADPPVVARVLRLAHTLKGAARIVKHRELAELAHALEDELAPLRTEPVPGRLDRALALVDRMAAAVMELPPPPPPDSAPEPAPAPAAGAIATVAAREQTSPSATVPPPVAVPRTTSPLPLIAGPEPAPRADAGALDGVLAQLADVHARANRLRAEVSGPAAAAVDALEREIREVRIDAERLRLTPASSLFTPLARAARDASLAFGRPVAFVGEGGDTRLDATVLATLQVALVQLVRNAVAHGIEPPAERAAAGKPTVGRVVVTITLHGAHVVVTCTDDGRGLELEAIRAVAGAPDSATADELIALLLRGGLTTATHVSELSGRGIGLDVVRDSLQQLRGEVTARTERGRGATFTLRAPVALSSQAVLVAATLERSVAVPIHAIRRVMRIHTPELVPRAGGGYEIPFDDVMVPVGALSVVLGFVFQSRTGSGAVIIFADDRGTLAGLSAERTVGVEDAVVHALPARTPFDPIVAGFAIDADGVPRPVLEPNALVQLIHGGMVAPPGPKTRATLPILVVDDSPTSRMVEQSMLESVGYTVELAASAEEALDKLAERAYALVLVDVEMPGMDGFQFVATLRAQPAHAALPAILVTSRDAPADRRRGRDVGAQGYIIKAELDQDELILMIRGLVRA